MRKINLMSGIPGSGKSHFIKNNADYRDIQLHRDDFRAALRASNNTDAYFPVSSSEEWKLWTEEINTKLTEYPDTNIWIDQTTIGTPSLSKIHKSLTLTENDQVIVHVFNLPLHICKGRNNLREGQERVPDDVMLSMYKNFKQKMITKSSARSVNPNIEVVFHNDY